MSYLRGRLEPAPFWRGIQTCSIIMARITTAQFTEEVKCVQKMIPLLKVKKDKLDGKLPKNQKGS